MRRIALLIAMLALFTTASASAQQIFTPICNGTNDTSRFQTIITGAAGAERTIRLPRKSAGTRCAVNTLVIPANITLDNTDGTGIKVNTGQTLTANGPVISDHKQIFYNALASQGTVAFTNSILHGVDVRWFGALGDGNYVSGGGTNDSAAFLAAINAAITGPHRVLIPQGVFRITTTVTKDFSSTHDLVFQGTAGSGSIIMLNTGAAADGLSFINAYSLMFRDITWAGDFTGGTGVPWPANPGATPDARIGLKFTNIEKLTFENNQFYGLFTPDGMIKAINSDTYYINNRVRGSFTSTGASAGNFYNNTWRGIYAVGNNFVDFGTLNGHFISKGGVSASAAWITAEKPAGELTETITPPNPPVQANMLAQNTVVIANNIFDEGAVATVRVISNTGIGEAYTSRVQIANNSANGSPFGGFAYYIQHVRNLEFVQNYTGYVYTADINGLYLDDVLTSKVSGNLFEQRATNIRIDGGGNHILADNRYASLTANTTTGLDLTDGGKRIRRTLAAGTYTAAQLAPVVSNVEAIRGADVPSGSSIVLTGNIVHVTGTTNITSITTTGIESGTEVTLIFDGVLTFTDGGNLVLAGNFVTTAGDSITLVYDGTNFIEKSRSVN
jgi:hypothetical protein